MTKPRGQYGFRLDTEVAKKLEAEAAKRGLTAGRYARLLVIDALSASPSEDDSVPEQLLALRDELQSLKENLETATVAILTSVADGATEDEVRTWAKENLG